MELTIKKMPAPKNNKNAVGNKGGRPEKWTKEVALKLGNDLIKWMSPKIVIEAGKQRDIHAVNILWEEFIVIEKGLYPDIISQLSNKFIEFSLLIKKAKKIQETKLVKYGIANRLQPAMTIFVLKNHHNYKDKKDITTDGDKITAITFNIKKTDGVEY